jgi:hypothetical protein
MLELGHLNPISLLDRPAAPSSAVRRRAPSALSYGSVGRPIAGAGLAIRCRAPVSTPSGRSYVATEQQCEQALHALAERLAASDGSDGKADFDRTLSCSLRDLRIVFTGRLKGGRLTDIARADRRDAQIRLTMTSDDLLNLVDGNLKMASAWATGQVKVEAGVRDLLRLRSIF